ncbi:hypothetical protein [Streptomyces sp. 7N604]|uniref:hypothetical protein n=1 Tax=Streptomyces sp. 7N604 TaxID=3457415 RepID=UPI003FD07AC9
MSGKGMAWLLAAGVVVAVTVLRSLDNASTRAGIGRLHLPWEARTTAPRRPWA